MNSETFNNTTQLSTEMAHQRPTLFSHLRLFLLLLLLLYFNYHYDYYNTSSLKRVISSRCGSMLDTGIWCHRYLLPCCNHFTIDNF
ncbi:Hypothetical predicted protein [Octopus vulgaris]|uniref:Uncharacterized protein n=1 Tax=Octopus vulgaris TaxID=6645 RepID=A0AA36BVD5_OCTVU|nr:Hypothetical predicted protein [Octopus vulgaris]